MLTPLTPCYKLTATCPGGPMLVAMGGSKILANEQ